MSEVSMPYNLEERSSGYYRVGVTANGMALVTGRVPVQAGYEIEQWACKDCQILMQNVTFTLCPNCNGPNLTIWHLETPDRVLVLNGQEVLLDKRLRPEERHEPC